MTGLSSKGASEIDDLRKEVERLRGLNEALQKSHPESALIVNAMSEMLALHSPDMQILWANRAAGDSVGMRAEELIGRHCWEIWHQRNEPCTDCPVLKARETKLPAEGEVRTPDGRWFFIRAYPICGGNGDVTSLVELTLEITDRKKAEQSLRESEERYRLLVESALVGVSICEGPKILFANRALLDMLGYQDFDEFAAVPFLEYLTPESRSHVRERFERIDHGEVPSRLFTVEAIRKGGEVRAFELTVSWTESEGRKYQHAIFTDVTERVRAEKLLRESEARYRALVETSSVGVAIVRGTQVVFGNRAILGMLGYESLEEFTAVPTIEHVAPHARADIAKRLQKVALGEDVPSRLVHDFVDKNGQIRTLEVAVAKIETAGEPLELATAIDVTERVTAERSLQASESRFRAVVESALVGVGIVRGNEVLFANRAILHMLGYESLEDFTAIPMTDHVAPYARPEIEERLRRIARGDDVAPQVIVDLIGKDGRIRTVEAAVAAIETNSETLHIATAIDVTERWQAEHRLRESEAKYRALVENTMVGVGIAQGNEVIFANRAVLDMLGYDSLEELAAVPVIHHAAPHIRPQIEEMWRKAEGRQELPSPMVIDVVRKDGRIRTIEASIAHIESGAGPQEIVTVIDVTERLESERRLRESEEKLRNIVEHSTNLFFSHGPDHVFTYLSPRIETMMGFEPDEVKMRWTEMLTDDPVNQEGIRLTDEAIRTGRPQRPYELEMFTRDGRRVWLEIHEAPVVVDGKTVAIVGAASDVTERHRAEQALRESEDRYRHLFEMESDAIILVEDSTGRILEVNPAASALYGYSREEFLRKNIADLLAEPEAVKMLDDRICSVRPVPRHRRKDGTVFPVEISGRYFRWQERLVHIATVRDITERRRVEDERLEMERRLLHAQKLESLGVLAGGIAHDFNNLLMAILGNLDLALLDVSSLSPARFSIEQAKQAARRAADLTRQMLAYSGKGRFVTRPVSLSELVQENAHLLKAAISKTVTLSLNLDRDLPSIMADPGQMQQVIMNLITNASEAIGNATGVVSLTTGIEDSDGEYLNRSSLEEKPPAGRYVYLEVTDTGCGMSQDTKHRLFDPFFSTKFTGRGLGMSAVSGIVHGHQGAIIVTSDVDRGSTIRVLFPAFTPKVAVVVPHERRHARRETAEPAAPLSGVILLVDDEEIVLNLCRNILERLGFRVLVATNGDEAVRAYGAHAGEIDCVLLDLTMPQLDGVAAFAELQRVRSDVKVILSSGYSQEEATRRFQGRGLAGFIQKPYEVQSLRDVLERVLRAPVKSRRGRRPRGHRPKHAAGRD